MRPWEIGSPTPYLQFTLARLNLGYHSHTRVSQTNFLGGDSMEPTMNPQNLQERADSLWNYLQSLDAEVVARLSRPASPEMAIVMERHIGNLLGYLPPEGFEVSITTNREHLGRLLASAMMSGYFLRGAEQRLEFERSLQAAAQAEDSK